MAEFLFVVNPALRRPGKQIGEPTSIEDDGFPWGSGERDTSVFRIVSFPAISKATARAIFFRDGVPRTVKTAEATARAALEAAIAENPQDPAKIATALATWRAAQELLQKWPDRRFHVDLANLGAGGTKTLLKLRQSSVRKGLEAWRDAISQGATRDVALAAAIAAATPVTDFATAATED